MKWFFAGIIGFFVVIMAITWIVAERAAPVLLPEPQSVTVTRS